MNQAFPGGLWLLLLKPLHGNLALVAAPCIPTVRVQPVTSGTCGQPGLPSLGRSVKRKSPFFTETPQSQRHRTRAWRAAVTAVVCSWGADLQLAAIMSEKNKQNRHRFVKMYPIYTIYPGKKCISLLSGRSQHVAKPLQRMPSTSTSAYVPEFIQLDNADELTF